ncbi:MAG TPA: hypothetical protein VMV23_03070 [Candidatus Nanopelagicaceae bacterium]|nr:hypothetical protein [Candidatus Nanopelagicaceae bacterium]
MSSELPPDAEAVTPEDEEEVSPTLVADEDDEVVEVEVVEVDVAEAAPVAVKPAPRPSPPRPWGGNRGNVAQEDLLPEELTPEMRWPPGTWVKVNDVVRHSTGEPIPSISVGDVGQVTAALSQTLVVLFPTRDNRREVIHIDSIEAVDPPMEVGKDHS